MIRKLLIALIFGLGLIGASAQEIQFSQYFSTSLYLNPAFSAVYVSPTFFVNYRRPVDNGVVYNETNQISAILPILINESDNTPRAGFGLMAYNNKSGFQGVFKVTGFLLNYAHNFSIGALNTEVVAIGIQSGYENYRVNFSELQWGTNYNPYYGYDDNLPSPVTEFDDAVSHPILNAGIMYYYNRERNFTIYNYSAFSGFAVTNINRPDKSFAKMGKSRAPMLFKYHGGIEFKARKFNFMPNLLAQYQRGNYTADGGIYTWYSFKENAFGTIDIKLVGGAWYRLRDSFNFLFGVNYNALSIKASYDMNSNLFYDDNIDYSRNHVEISLQYTLSKENRIRKISNPLF